MSEALIEAVIDQATIEAYESLNKWKNPKSSGTEFPTRLVFPSNRTKAANKGFPSVLQIGTKDYGLTDHEVAALFGWTTGDYRMVNPIARGQEVVEFEDYPLLPQEFTKITFSLSREEVLPYVAITKSALSKLPPLQMVCWRGHKRSLPKEIGSTFRLEGFISATLDRDNALEFCVKVDGQSSPRNLQRTLICFVESKSGKSISKFSARPEEMEVLFLPDTQWQVVQPPEGYQDDLQAVTEAMNDLQKKTPEASIDLLYVKEVQVGA